MKKIVNRKFLYFLFVIMFFAFFNAIIGKNIALAESEVRDIKKECAECERSTDLKDINFSEYHVASEQALNVISYFQCLAIAKNDSSQCSKLVSPDREKCYNQFFSISFFMHLAFDTNFNMEYLKSCTDSKNGDNKTCKAFIDGFLKKDVSVCASLKKNIFPKEENCKAVILLNEELASDAVTTDIVYFINAIRNADVALCKKVSDKNLKLKCTVLLSGDVDACKKNEGYFKIIKSYCADKVKNKKDN